ncbi:MAG: hypothetical protein ACHRHE_13550 [Tepidisphaerales bacterium]
MKSATIHIQFDQYSDSRRTIVVQDAEELRDLLAFFPGIGTNRHSNIAGGWFPGVVIEFQHVNGDVTRVYVDLKLRVWHEMLGDWWLDPGFRSYLKRLMSRHV